MSGGAVYKPSDLIPERLPNLLISLVPQVTFNKMQLQKVAGNLDVNEPLLIFFFFEM